MFKAHLFFSLGFALLICSVMAHSNPFSPSTEVSNISALKIDYRVSGVAILKARALAAIWTSDKQIRIVEVGERINNLLVKEITLDSVYLETESGVLRLVIE